MADKPSGNQVPGSFRAASSQELSGPNGHGDFEIRLRSTERIKLVLQRCARCSAPQHLVVRIHETLIEVTSRDSRQRPQ